MFSELLNLLFGLDLICDVRDCLFDSHVAQINKHFILEVIVFDVIVHVVEFVVFYEMLFRDHFIVEKISP